uniref:Uncharacterized protein n=1 Tax=Arundo donax TaxID=35708 RepID=A0A0A9EHG5_ARUDO
MSMSVESFPNSSSCPGPSHRRRGAACRGRSGGRHQEAAGRSPPPSPLAPRSPSPPRSAAAAPANPPGCQSYRRRLVCGRRRRS